MKVSEKQIKDLIRLYNQGYTRPQMSIKLKMPESTVDKQLQTLFKSGTLKTRAQQRKEAKEERKKAESQPLDDGAVKCSIEVSRRCVYGYESKERCRSLGLCDYIMRTGHMRECPTWNCTKFEEITSNNPRRNDIM